MFGCDYYFTWNGRKVEDWQKYSGCQDGKLRIWYRLVGGKGGFGSMLRALGAQIEKTTNREACRDLSGRRMRDVNNEKKIADWLNKQAEKDAEKRKRKQEKLERILNPPKHIMDSQTYVHTIQETAEEIDSALRKGLAQKGSTAQKGGHKRKATETLNSPKKPKGWLGMDNFEDEDCVTEDPSSLAYPEPRIPTSVSEQDRGREDEPSSSSASSSEVDPGSDPKPCSSNESAGREGNGDEPEHIDANGDKGTSVEPKGGQDSSKVVKGSSEMLKAEPINLELYDTIEELESLGLDRLKQGLIAVGLKCGGTLIQRAERLFLLKTTPLDKLDRSLFAGAKGKSTKKGRKN